MKKLYTLLLLATLITAFTTAQVNLNLGLVAAYPMNNSGLDSTSNHLNLTAHGFPAGTTDRFGIPNSSYELNSSNPDYLTAALNSLMAPTELTLSAWVKLPNAVPDQKIAGRCGVGAGGYLLGVDSNKIDAEIWDLSTPAVIHYRLKANGVLNNVWTHIAMSFKANDYLKVYINGTVMDSIPSGTTGAGTSNTWPFTVGAAPWSVTALNANGAIDDIYLYNRALNASEVMALYSLILGTIEGQSTLNLSSLYPVPVHEGILSVDFGNSISGHVTVKIFDALGRDVYSSGFFNPKKEQLDLHSLQKGLYSVSFVYDGRTETHKLVIQ